MAKIWFLVLSSREAFPLTSITSGHRVLCSVNRDHREQSKIINTALKISLPILPTMKEKLYNGPTKVTILYSSQMGGSCIQVLNGSPNKTPSCWTGPMSRGRGKPGCSRAWPHPSLSSQAVKEENYMATGSHEAWEDTKPVFSLSHLLLVWEMRNFSLK